MKFRNDITKLIAKLIKNKLTDEERQELEDWATASEENMRLFVKYTDHAFVDKELKRYHEIDIHPGPEWNQVVRMRKKRKRLRRSISIMKYSAVAALVAGIIVTPYMAFFKADKPLIPIAMIHASAPDQDTRTIKMPDGSETVLDSKSDISYPKKFEGKTRDVYLTGRGFFKIKPQNTPAGKQVPFIVHIGEDQIEVKGTEFNVDAYQGKSMSTTLIKGNITMTVNGKKYYLQPNDRLTKLNNFKDSVIKETVKPDLVIAWKSGYFQFDNTPLKEALDEIEHWYPVKFDPISPNQKHKNITLSQTSRKTPQDNLISSIEFFNGIKLPYKNVKP